MGFPIASLISCILVLLLPSLCAVTADPHIEFVQCLSLQSHNSSSISKVIYTSKNSSYLSVLDFSIQNLRFALPRVPKPRVIVTPLHESEVQAVVYCSKKHGLQIRTRSGGHDYEGLSYVSEVPFVMLDLINLRTINIDVESATAWVHSGATLGELYYNVAKKSNNTLAFPAGVCPTVGVGGHICGGGYGTLMRKYGLAADNVIDVRLIDANGEILDRKSMSEDYFWAIRGGGGANFGVILAYKIKLVAVPQIVTIFSPIRTLEQNATKLVHRWQYVAPKFLEDLFMRVVIQPKNATQSSKLTVQISFNSLFLGRIDRLLPLMQESFPEMGLTRQDCQEVTWIESTLPFNFFPSGTPVEALLDRGPADQYFKGKSDYAEEPIPEHGLEGIWRFFFEKEAQGAVMILNAYGGKMAEIPEDAIPYPHRAGNLLLVHYMQYWTEGGSASSKRHINWIRRLHSYMTPFVSKSPRAAYLNYRDLDLGKNNEGYTSYAQASIWGLKYFKNNFRRLVHVKTTVDPGNIFKNKQSIPPLL